jgi:hypothetical protein
MKTKNIGGFLGFLSFSIILVWSTVGNLGIGNSFAQAQRFQAQAISTISMTASQPLCKAGICNNDSTQKNIKDPTTRTLTQTFTNIKTPTLNHTFKGSTTIGPDTFRFINSFWSPTGDYH